MSDDKYKDYDSDDFFKKFDELDEEDPYGPVEANRSKRYASKDKRRTDEELISDLEDLFDDPALRPEKKARKRKSKRKEPKPYTDKKDNLNYDRFSTDEIPAKKRSKKKLSKKEFKQLQKKEKKKHRRRKWAKRIISACAVMMVAGIVMVAFILQDTQEVNWDNIYDYLSESSTIYDDSGKKIDNLYSSAGSRTIVKYEDMPENLINAFVSIEDKTFWDHHGFNFTRMAGAVLESLRGEGRVGGTSTVTQQLARNLWLTETKSDRSLIRKIKEAYYAIQIERHLSKEEIIEAYLNTIALGQNSLGIQTASQTYFSKDVNELNLLECAALAALPQAPSTYSYIKTVASDEVSSSDSDIVKTSKYNTYLYNGIAEGRVETVLYLMDEQGYISTEEKEKVDVAKLRNHIKPNIEERTNEAQFFVDYAIKDITRDLMREYNHTEKEALQMIYSGGLKIYTTLNRKMQAAVEEEFSNNSNFPSVTNLKKDKNDNILNDKKEAIILYKYSNFFDGNGSFTLSANEFAKTKDGDILLKKGRRLKFFETESDQGKDINAEFKALYKQENGIFYSIDGGVINIPAKYKELDSDGNLIIKSEFFSDKAYEGFMKVEDKKIVIPAKSYTLRQQIQQPQSSMVIMNHSTGQIKAMVGGRNIEGKMNFNRSISPRQPGSSIKPISVYAPALESGDYTAATIVRDEKMTYQGKVWPKNWYSGYRGNMTIRKAVEQSVNTIAVKVLNDVGTNDSMDFLEKLGISTIVKSGNSNDTKPAALALGGMTKGISPLEMAAAYGTFPNKGTYVDPTTYSEIRSKDDALVMKNDIETTQVMNEGTAFIMNDILRTTVTNGIAGRASMGSQPVAGKTGTTTDNYDAWFVGSTPKYVAAVWIGNDISIELSEGSGKAAALWSKIMTAATKGDKREEFSEAPDNVEKETVNGRSEYFIKGTAP